MGKVNYHLIPFSNEEREFVHHDNINGPIPLWRQSLIKRIEKIEKRIERTEVRMKMLKGIVDIDANEINKLSNKKYYNHNPVQDGSYVIPNGWYIIDEIDQSNGNKIIVISKENPEEK